jgi:hypothetical protein
MFMRSPWRVPLVLQQRASCREGGAPAMGVNKTSISLNGRFVKRSADVALIASRCSVQRAICEPHLCGRVPSV